MFDSITEVAHRGTLGSLPFDPLRAFIDQHRDALCDAAALLGGPRGTRIARTVIDGLAGSLAPSRRVLRALDQLRDLLTLEHVHDPDREEAAYFAAIDPADACVEEICLLADGLCDAIAGYRAHADRRAAA